MRTYTVETSSGLVRGATLDTSPQNEMVPNLWSDNTSIFFYDRDRLQDYINQERLQDMSGERGLAQIINIMEMKWQRMDRYWFQKNRHLDRKMRTKKEAGSNGGTNQ